MEPWKGYSMEEICSKYLVCFDESQTRARILFSQSMEDLKYGTSPDGSEHEQTEFLKIRKGSYGFSIGGSHAADACGIVSSSKGPLQGALFQKITNPAIYAPQGSFEINEFMKMGNRYEPHQSYLFSMLNPGVHLSSGGIFKIKKPGIFTEDMEWEISHNSPDALVWSTPPDPQSSWDPVSMNALLEELSQPEKTQFKPWFESFLGGFEDILYPVEYKISCLYPRTSIPPSHLCQCICEAYATKSKQCRYLSSYIEQGKLKHLLHLEIRPQEQLFELINRKLDQFSISLFHSTQPISEPDDQLLRSLFDMTTIIELNKGTPLEVGLPENVLSEIEKNGLSPLIIR